MIFIVNAENRACFKHDLPNLGHCEGQDPALALNTDSRTLPTIDALPDALVTQLRDFYAGDAS